MERPINGMAVSDVEGAERAAGGPFAPPVPDDPKPGETWRHYKGRDYEIIAVGLDEATRTPMIAYRCPDSGQTWFRTLANFTEVVQVESNVRVKVTEDNPAGEPGFMVPCRRFSRVGRPKDDGPAVSQHGKPSDPAPLKYTDRLVYDFDVSDDSPVVKGTWVTVSHVVDMVVDGRTWGEIIRSHPEITEDDIRACLAYAVAEQDASPVSQDGNPGPEDVPPYSLESDVESLVAAVFRAIPPGQRLVFEGPA